MRCWPKSARLRCWPRDSIRTGVSITGRGTAGRLWRWIARRHFLITYDISDDKRRTKIFHTLQSNGDHAQFSVFFCQLNSTELARVRSDLLPLINAAEDQVLIVDLGKVYSDDSLRLEALGQPYSAPTRAMIV